MKAPPPRWDVLVVGGGPAGMAASGRAAECGARVLLLERGPTPGRKLLLTGNGRCNLSNAAPGPEFVRAYGPARGFLRKALSVFDQDALTRWLRRHGVETVQEEDGRVFPADHDARSVLRALRDYMRAGGVQMLTDRRVESLMFPEGRLAGVQANGVAHAAQCVVIATGGLSYPATGSSGDGYDLARQAGHSVVTPYAAVGALRTRETWPDRLQGTPAAGAAVRARLAGGRTLARAAGDVMWTHYGVSGPAVLRVSLAVTQALREGADVVLELDLIPDRPQDDLHAELRQAAASGVRRTLARFLAQWLPRRTAGVLAEVMMVDPSKQVARCSRHECALIARTLKCLPLRVAGAQPLAEAIVTGGGVDRQEVDPRRMESERLAGLFFAGEVLDAHGPSGGFNLHAAFATGYVAGESAASRIHTRAGPC
jgi:predicted Rossmann fold flavoprotein